MSWFNTEGASSPHIIWSGVRYIRNPAIPFYKRSNAKALEDINSDISTLLTNNGFHMEELPAGYCPKVCALAEKQFVPYELIRSELTRAVYFNDPCSLIISTGGKNFLDIRSLLSGRALSEALNIASKAEELLDRKLEFAYSDKLGYLSPCPSYCGSGVEFSAAVYLPSAKHSTYGERLHAEAKAFGADLSPMMACAENPEDLYILSYIPKFRTDEKTEINRFDALLGRIYDCELRNERIIFADRSKITVDNAYRAFGILSYARSVSEGDLLSLLSDLRLCLSLFPEQIQDLPIDCVRLNSLIAGGLNNSLIDAEGRPCKDKDECDSLRAHFIKKILLPANITPQDTQQKEA